MKYSATSVIVIFFVFSAWCDQKVEQSQAKLVLPPPQLEAQEPFINLDNYTPENNLVDSQSLPTTAAQHIQDNLDRKRRELEESNNARIDATSIGTK